MRGDEIVDFYAGGVKNFFSNTRLFLYLKKRWDNLSNIQSKFFSFKCLVISDSQDFFYSKNKIVFAWHYQISEINYCLYNHYWWRWIGFIGLVRMTFWNLLELYTIYLDIYKFDDVCVWNRPFVLRLTCMHLVRDTFGGFFFLKGVGASNNFKYIYVWICIRMNCMFVIDRSTMVIERYDAISIKLDFLLLYVYHILYLFKQSRSYKGSLMALP